MMLYWLPKINKDSQISEGHQTVGEGNAKQVLVRSCLRSPISWQDYHGKVLWHRTEITFIPEIVPNIFVGIFLE